MSQVRTTTKTTNRTAFGLAFGLVLLTAVGFAPTAGAQQTGGETAPQEMVRAGSGVVGISVGLDADAAGEPARLVVQAVVPQSPAEEAGLQPGDEIVAIDGQATEGMGLRDVVEAVRGEAGTPVELTLNRDGQEQTVSLTREQRAASTDQAMPRRPGMMGPMMGGMAESGMMGGMMCPMMQRMMGGMAGPETSG